MDTKIIVRIGTGTLMDQGIENDKMAAALKQLVGITMETLEDDFPAADVFVTLNSGVMDSKTIIVTPDVRDVDEIKTDVGESINIAFEQFWARYEG